MKFTSLWKGLAIAATLFLIGSEAFAQLPVRTQSLQLIGTTSGTLTQRSAATTTSYYMQWPSAQPTNAIGDTAILYGVKTATGIDMDWRELTGDLVDGTGANGFVAWWQDANTLTYSNNFAWNGTTLGVGTAGATGNVSVGDGTNVTGTLNGSAGDLTLGTNVAGGPSGTVVLNEGGAAGSAITIETGSQTNGYTVTFDDAPSTGSHVITPSTNNAGAGTIDYIFVSNGDGTGTWVANPTQSLKSGIVTPAANAYSAAVTFNTVYAAVPAVTVSAVGPVANGYILQVTGVSVNGFTILSSAPFDGTDTISWVANAQYNP